MNLSEREHIKDMVDLLRQGATLTELSCPVCSSPLFRLRNKDLWCARCQKQVVVVKEGEAPIRATSPLLLDSLESTILMKIQDIERKIREETSLERLHDLGGLLSMLLSNLERVRKIKGSSQ